eukprot:gene22001-26502_t
MVLLRKDMQSQHGSLFASGYKDPYKDQMVGRIPHPCIMHYQRDPGGAWGPPNILPRPQAKVIIDVKLHAGLKADDSFNAEGHRGYIFSLTYDELHKSVISGGKDNTIVVWQQDGTVKARLDCTGDGHYPISM